MFVLIATLFTLFYYSTLLKLPITIGSLQTILFIDIITSFLYFWMILNKRNTMIQKAIVVFLCGLASDVFLLNSIYFNSIFYLLLLIFIDQNNQIKTDKLLRVLYFIGFNFVMILIKSLILSSLGKVNFFHYFLTNAVLQLPISTIIGFCLILPLVRLVLKLSERPKKRYIKTELT